ncbi:hypothetical protein ACQCVH_09840 [Bacillus infantis]|uniref:hypothetical protein n=1 Tax=Bacillus infantis TaxID=324767 RepID=UPI003CE6A620
MSETAQALRRLEDFRLVREENEDPLSVKAGQLLLPGEMEIYLNRLAKELDAPIPAAGSLFIKRYSFLAVIYLYSFTAGNCRLDGSFANITVVSAYKNGMWLPCFYLKNTGSKSKRSLNRAKKGGKTVLELYSQNICKFSWKECLKLPGSPDIFCGKT